MIQIIEKTWGEPTEREIAFRTPQREDFMAYDRAVELGYTVWTKSAPVAGIPYNSLSFKKGPKHIWMVYGYGFKKGWACAEVIGGYFRNHRYYGSLSEALETEAEAEFEISIDKGDTHE